MNITIYSIEVADLKMLDACIKRIKRFYTPPLEGHSGHPEIHCRERGRDGVLEYILKLPYPGSTNAIWVVAIERTPGSEVEFHS